MNNPDVENLSYSLWSLHITESHVHARYAETKAHNRNEMKFAARTEPYEL